jgi:hypothetical protein
MVAKKHVPLILVGLMLFILVLFAALLPHAFAAVQRSYVLDLGSANFSFEENALNDSSSSKEYSFPSPTGGNVSYWIRIPKNSSVLNATITLTGKIIPIYNVSVNSASYGILGMSIGDVIGDSANETVTGTYSNENTVRVLFGRNGTEAWNISVGSSNNKIFSTAIGNITSDAGNEIVAGSEDNKVYVINAADSGGTLAWNFSTNGDVKTVSVGDLESDGLNEIAAGSGEGRVYIINFNGTQRWNYSIGGINDVVIANISSDPGNEVIVGASNGIYAINSSGSLLWSRDLFYEVKAISVNDVTSDPGNEIAAGTGSPDNRVYLLNSTGYQIWNYSTGGEVNSVITGDVTSDAGNEVIAGSDDYKIYTLNSSGSLIWYYTTQSLVRAVEAGNLTTDSGNEVVAATTNGYLYAFNFDYFPDNISIDANGSAYDWAYSGKLRSSAQVSGASLVNAIQSSLSSCTPDLSGVCNSSLMFHSDWPGILNISNMNVTYAYNISSLLSAPPVSSVWSRTRNVNVNESVGYQIRNISFAYNPSQDISVQYIGITTGATACDFNGSSYSTATAEGQMTCNVPDFTIPRTGSLPGPYPLWDSTMTTGNPVLMQEYQEYYTYTTDNFLWRKNLTIYNTTSTVIYNVTANFTLNDTAVKGLEFLNVSWSGSWCDLTPASGTATCNTTSPSYAAKSCSGQTFYACKMDTNSNGVYDFFRWVQPYSSSSAAYVAGGSTNLAPNLTGQNVTLSPAIWGNWFNYSLNVSDADYVNVTLWVMRNLSGSWQRISEINVTSPGPWFNTTSDMTWTGLAYYKFQYQDFNSSGYPIHSSQNTSSFSGPLVLKHNVSVELIQGNNSAVNRSASVLLAVRINDTENSSWVDVGGTRCAFWISTGASVSIFQNTSNSSGYCQYLFTPDGNFSPGNQTWKAGVLNDTYYSDGNSSNFVLTVKGRINITLIAPSLNQTLYRNSSNTLFARMIDEYGSQASQSGYNCTFWFVNATGSSMMGNSTTNSSGWCTLSWDPACSVSLGQSSVNVTLEGTSEFYSIDDWEANAQVLMKDYLRTSIYLPVPQSYYHKGDYIILNSSTNDTCSLCSQSDYQDVWSLKWKQSMLLVLNETRGFSRSNETIIINGSELEAMGVDLSDWRISHTKVLLNGQEIPSEIKPWTDSAKTQMNSTQIFMSNYSELIFLSTLTALQGAYYLVHYNETNPSDWNISFIRNGGFEQGLSTWQCVNGSHCDATNLCGCSSSSGNGESAGNYSLQLHANRISLTNVTSSAYLSLGMQMNSSYIKVRYKTGGFIPGLALFAGSGSCVLNASSSWADALCYNSSFQSASIISFVLSDTEVGQSCYAYFDYLCIADSSGNCTAIDHGYSSHKAFQTQTSIGSGNSTWQVPANETLGSRMILLNSSGAYHAQNFSTASVFLFGWSNISWMNLSSAYCTYNQTFECMSNATIDFFCRALDNQTSQGIGNYNVSFFINGTLFGYNMTNSTGYALFRWQNSTNVVGTYNVSCNISDTAYEPSTYYNITSGNSASLLLDIISGNTTGYVLLQPASESATGVTREQNHSFSLNVSLVNTGNGSMYSPAINISSPAGVQVQAMYCPTISPNSSCSSNLAVNIMQSAEASDLYINITALWSNADSTQSNATNATAVSVENNTVLNITEVQLNMTISRGDSRAPGNFTVEAFGNTPLSNVSISLSGGNSSSFSSWVSYTPASISTLAKSGSQPVLFNLTVPPGATEGIYTATLTANSTGSSCSPASECWDSIPILINVTPPDWDITPANLSKTIGLNGENGSIGTITVTSNRAQNLSFSINVSGNGSGYIRTDRASFNLTPFSTAYVHVYHNTSAPYSPGYWFANVTIRNLDGAFPPNLNVSINLGVINLTVQILTPNQTSPSSPVNASQRINITVNATLSGAPVSSNMVWSATVGGQACGDVQSSYSAGVWNLNCTAPSISGNVIYNTLIVTGNYTSMQGTIVSDTETDAVRYADMTPPQLSGVSVSPANYYQSMPYIIINATITDNSDVHSAWLVITQPNGTNVSIASFTNSSSLYTFNFSNPNSQGDYDIYVYANDSSGYANSTMGWFDVYRPFQISGTLADPYSRNQSSSLVFYRPGTSTVIHSFSTNASQGSYNLSGHDRIYDVRISSFGQTVTLYGVNTTASARNQYNASATNVTDVFRLHDFPNRTSQDISNFDLPNTAQNIILGFVIETPNLSYSNATITIDYTSALAAALGTITVQESNLRMFRCTNWNFLSRVCSAGEFSHFNESLTPDTTANTFTFTSTPSTAYAVAESCYPNICGQSPITPPGTGTTPSTGGGTGTTTQAACGNGRCETGENTQNCPQDCPAETFPFTVKTGVTNIRLRPGDKAIYPLYVTNSLNRTIRADISISGLENFFTLEKPSLQISPGKNESSSIFVVIPETTEPGTYTGTISVSAEGKTKDIPVTMVISLEGRSQLALTLKILTKIVEPENDLKYTVTLVNIGFSDNITLNMIYTVRNANTEEIMRQEKETLNLSLATGDSYSATKVMKIRENDPPVGQYYLEAVAEFGYRSVSDTGTFDVAEVFWITPFGQFMTWMAIVGSVVFIAYYERRKYKKWKMKKSRYIFPVNYSKLPLESEEAFNIGRIAETEKPAWFNPNDLSTHVLIAGSTGSGKSVSASVIVEEALEKKIPVVVFDPTAQWTGFVKACEDQNLLKYYKQFGMDERYVKPYKGMIFEITDPHVTLDFKKYMNPGEITVFTMNKLGPGEYDVAVKNIISAIFRTGWEESTNLKMIMVFDEVHRLLEKYGGIGGYLSLEQACREFRKWGIGIIMCSQVLADFKEAISGNVLTDIQMNTKSLIDIRKVETKYGPEYSTRISRQGVGVGMMQHPKYNDGKPYFVQFRPTWHNPHKITDEEMEMYKEFAKRLEVIEQRIEDMKKRKDTSDIEIELKLAKDKLKQGRFRMAKIYITSLEDHLNIRQGNQ